MEEALNNHHNLHASPDVMADDEDEPPAKTPALNYSSADETGDDRELDTGGKIEE